jgi:hypothetical protein
VVEAYWRGIRPRRQNTVLVQRVQIWHSSLCEIRAAGAAIQVYGHHLCSGAQETGARVLGDIRVGAAAVAKRQLCPPP